MFSRESENTKLKLMTSWLFPYDSKKFKLDQCLASQGFVEWHQLNNFQVGDILYFYASLPVKRITHVMKVVKINIRTQDTVDDSKFKTEFYDITLKSEPVNFRVELLKRLNTEKLTSEELAKYGLKTKRVPVQKLKDSLLKYIEKVSSIG